MKAMDDKGVTQPPPQRLNLIFHGLMAFLDVSSDYYEVLIPKTGGCHEAWYGNPRHCAEPSEYFTSHHLHEFARGRGPGPAMYSIEGIYPSAPSDIGKPAKANALILAKSKLNVNYTSVRNLIRVRKPNIVRHYRGGETRNIPLAGDLLTQALFTTPPTAIHEITVFSYFCFNSPHLVGPENHSHKIHEYPGRHGGAFWNLCIYSQPRKEPCLQSDSNLFNAMFTHISNGAQPSVNLAMVETHDDGPPRYTGDNVGIAPIELKTLYELEHHPVATPELSALGNGLLSSTLGGCGNSFVCDDSDTM